MLPPPTCALPACAALGCLAWAAASDAARFRIPNPCCAALLALWPAAALCGLPVHPASAAAAFALTLLATGALWRRGLWGGGDFKLMTALAPWAGLERLYDLAAVTALAGGALALLVLCARARQPGPRLGRRVPYGIAIALSGALVILRAASSPAAP